jgi:hypothetical protein
VSLLVLRESLLIFAIATYEMDSPIRCVPFVAVREVVAVIAIFNAPKSAKSVILIRVDPFHDLPPQISIQQARQ